MGDSTQRKWWVDSFVKLTTTLLGQAIDIGHRFGAMFSVPPSRRAKV